MSNPPILGPYDGENWLITPAAHLAVGAIREWVEEHGYPPSVREIGDAVGLQSTSSVHHQLRYQPFDGAAASLRDGLRQLTADSSAAESPPGGRRRGYTVGVLAGDARAVGSMAPEVDERRAICGAFVTVVEQAAAQAPVLLSLDDLRLAGTTGTRDHGGIDRNGLD